LFDEAISNFGMVTNVQIYVISDCIAADLAAAVPELWGSLILVESDV